MRNSFLAASCRINHEDHAFFVIEKDIFVRDTRFLRAIFSNVFTHRIGEEKRIENALLFHRIEHVLNTKDTIWR